MFLTKYSGNCLNSIFDGFFDRDWDLGLSNFLNGSLSNFYPKVDVIESKNKYSITLDLPGMSKEDIKIKTEEGNLIISGERKSNKKEEKTHYSERSHGNFLRSFSLPSNIDEKNIEAKYENGVLDITLIKIEETKPKSNEITIQ